MSLGRKVGGGGRHSCFESIPRLLRIRILYGQKFSGLAQRRRESRIGHIKEGIWKGEQVVLYIYSSRGGLRHRSSIRQRLSIGADGS
jgi:hypothetical protein